MYSRQFILKAAAKVPPASGSRLFTTSTAQGYQARLYQHYQNTLRDDLMILQYQPPAVREQQDKAEEERLQALKEKAGGTPPNPNRKHKKIRSARPKVPYYNAHNSPKIEAVTVHIRCKEALQNKHHLLSALMALQIITGKQAEVVKAKNDAATWKLRKGMPIAAKVALSGDQMYEFLDKLIQVVLPRMKEYGGLRMDNGDGMGNFSLGFDYSVIGLFPEMEMVYDQFPLVPGFMVNIKTSAVRNPPGRLLLSGFNLPFVHARKTQDETFKV